MKILLGMPNLGQIQMQTVTSLVSMLGSVKGMTPLFISNSLIYTARDFIAEYAVENGFDYVLYVDSDMVFSADDFNQLMVTMLGTGAEVVSGTYVTRVGEPRIVAYNKVERRESRPFKSPSLKNVDLYSTKDIEEVEAAGFGFCLIKVSLLKKMFVDFPSLFEPKWGFGEDVAFCQRAKRYTKIILDRRVNLGHLGMQVNNVPQMDLKTKFAQKSSSGMGKSEVTNGKD